MRGVLSVKVGGCAISEGGKGALSDKGERGLLSVKVGGVCCQ